MATDFLHCVEVIQRDTGTRPIRIARSGVIGLVGTAPDADPAQFPLDTPVMVTNLRECDGLKSPLGPATGSLYHACQLIYAQARAVVVIVRVQEGAGATDTETLLATLPNLVGSTTSGVYTGVNAFLGAKTQLGVAPRILLAPEFTSHRPVGVKTIAVTNGGAGYTCSPAVAIAGGGLSATATAVITDGAVTAVNITYPGTGYVSAPVIGFSGGGGTGAAATATVGGVVSSVTITAPGWGYTLTPTLTFTGGGGSGAAATATIGTVANPAAAAMLGIADRLRAVVLIDGPASNDAEAIQTRQDYGSKRAFLTDPGVQALLAGDTAIRNYPASPVVAGLIARSDSDRGFWWSPSNQTINGIVGLTRTVDFTLGDSESRANLLNESEVTTIIREDGFRLWGNRTCAADPQWAFLSVVSTADIIADSLMREHLWAVDRCINRGHIESVTAGVNAFLRHLRGLGAILGGQCWVDPTLNTPEEISAGHITFDFDFTPPFPAERVTFRSHITNEYVKEILPPNQ